MIIKYENQNYTAEWRDNLFISFGGKKLIIRDASDKVISKRKFTYGQWLFQHDSPSLYKSMLDDIFHPSQKYISKELSEYLDLDELYKK